MDSSILIAILLIAVFVLGITIGCLSTIYKIVVTLVTDLRKVIFGAKK